MSHVINVLSIKTTLIDGMAKLVKIGTLGGWIAKIKTLEVELKMALNFGGDKGEFSQ